MSREIPWIDATEIDWNVGDVWLVELKDEVCSANPLTAPWAVVQVQELWDSDDEPVLYLFGIGEFSDVFVEFADVWRGLCLEVSETA